MTGSAFSLSAAFAGNGFSITKGERVVGGLHGTTCHFFCPRRMSRMFTRPDGFDFVNVRATKLDDPSGFSPFIETVCAGVTLILRVVREGLEPSTSAL